MTTTELEAMLRELPEKVVAKGQGYLCPDGRVRPRVTTVEKLIGLGSEALVGWAARTEKEAVLEAVKACHGYAQGMTPEGFVATIEKHIGSAKAHIRKMNVAADIGSAVHAEVEQYMKALIRGESYKMTHENPEVMWAIMAFEDWWAGAGLAPLVSEQFVYCSTLDTAGTIDLICQRDDGSLGIVDFKTSNYLLPVHHVQVATYQKMGQNWLPLEWATLVRIPKKYGEVAIEVKPLGEIWDDRRKETRRVPVEDLVAAFQAARELYRVFLE